MIGLVCVGYIQGDRWGRARVHDAVAVLQAPCSGWWDCWTAARSRG